MSDRFGGNTYLAGEGEMRVATREFDWARSPLGAIATWSNSLRNIVNLVVNSRHPMFIFWGPELVQFYNDAYRPSLGLERHPAALGARGREFWSEIWTIIGPQIEAVMQRGESTWHEDHLVPIFRNGRLEEVYWTYGYSPVWDDDGRIGGALVVVQEQTQRVLTARRVRTVRDLASTASLHRTQPEAWLAGLDVLSANPADIPWVLGFAIGGGGTTARLVGQRPLDVVDENKLLREFHLAPGGAFRRIIETGAPETVDDLRALVGHLVVAPWPEPVVSARLIPLRGPRSSHPYGILAVGLSPRLPFDEEYADFLTMAADQLANAIANAQAHEDEQRHLDELAQLSRRFRELLEQAPAGVAVFGGADHRYELANPIYRAITHRSNVIGRTFLEVFPELTGKGLPVVLDHVYATGEAFVADEYLVELNRTGDGHLESFFYSFNLAPLREKGVITGLIVVAIDVTGQVTARRNLQRAQERLTFTLDAAGVGYWNLDLLTHEAVCSLRHFQIFGYAEGKTAWTFEDFLSHVVPEERDRVVALVRHATEKGNDLDFESGIQTAAGEARWIQVQARVVRENGVSVRLLGIVHDVSERRDLLAREQAARKVAEHASHAKDQFLATLSHELRTPMNTIIGWTDLLTEGGLLPEEAQEGLRTIHRHAQSQARMIEELLDMGRIVSGKLHINPRLVRVDQVVGHALEAVAHAAKAKGVRLVAEPASLDRFVTGDAALLQQVFWNLLGNAVKFTPAGGTVQVMIARVGTLLEISIRDSGEGIAAEFLPHVFDRFRQADGTSTRLHGGLGIGLSIVKQLVEAHGGTVRAESAGRGLGAAFTVSLPRADPHGKPASGPDPRLSALPERQLQGARILVVDDDADTRYLISHILTGCLANVVTAESTAEALGALHHQSFDLLVTDIGMPFEDGYELIRKVRSLGPGRGGALPALALTAYGRPEDRRRALDEGFQEHATKPIQPARLLAMCAALIASSAKE